MRNAKVQSISSGICPSEIGKVMHDIKACNRFIKNPMIETEEKVEKKSTLELTRAQLKKLLR